MIVMATADCPACGWDVPTMVDYREIHETTCPDCGVALVLEADGDLSEGEAPEIRGRVAWVTRKERGA